MPSVILDHSSRKEKSWLRMDSRIELITKSLIQPRTRLYWLRTASEKDWSSLIWCLFCWIWHTSQMRLPRIFISRMDGVFTSRLSWKSIKRNGNKIRKQNGSTKMTKLKMITGNISRMLQLKILPWPNVWQKIRSTTRLKTI